VLAAIVSVPGSIGYPLLAVFVAAESAGALVPGETSLIVAGALAGSGRLSLPLVIAVAASAAIVGDNIGYQIGRRGLRRLLDRPGRRRAAIERGEAFFRRHGAATVFFGRWLPGLRVAASWLAGANRMPWRRFLLWNSLGGISWAATVGSAAYLLGRTASGWLAAIGLVGVAIVVLVELIRRLRPGEPASPARAETIRSPRQEEVD
jgi:membrane protein DedA with SNARE-associated domain